jgi:hypothetical protein
LRGGHGFPGGHEMRGVHGLHGEWIIFCIISTINDGKPVH